MASISTFNLIVTQSMTTVVALCIALISLHLFNDSKRLGDAAKAAALVPSGPSPPESLSQRHSDGLLTVKGAVNEQAGLVHQLNQRLESKILAITEGMTANTKDLKDLQTAIKNLEERSEKTLVAVRGEASGIRAELTETRRVRNDVRGLAGF